MQIKVNDTPKDIPRNTTIEKLLAALAVKGPLAVELNRKVCPKALHNNTLLKEGDVLEIVTIVGGG
jgi:thiamine biosynthesis protein ThiS